MGRTTELMEVKTKKLYLFSILNVKVGEKKNQLK